MITVYERDSLAIVVAVKDQDAAAFPLIGAAAVGAIKMGDDVIAAVISYPDQGGGVVKLVFPAGTFLGQVGVHEVQARVTKAGEVGTVFARSVRVLPSI